MPKKIKRKRDKKAPAFPRECRYPLVAEVDFGIYQLGAQTQMLLDAAKSSLREDNGAFQSHSALFSVLSHLADTASAATQSMAILLGHGAFPGVLMLERLIFEYALRVKYCILNEEYAEWEAYIEMPRQLLRLRGGQMSDKDRRLYDFSVRDMRREHSHLVRAAREREGKLPFESITIADMARAVGGTAMLEDYGEMSALLHGGLVWSELSDEIDGPRANQAVCRAIRFMLDICRNVASQTEVGQSLLEQVAFLQNECVRIGRRLGMHIAFEEPRGERRGA